MKSKMKVLGMLSVAALALGAVNVQAGGASKATGTGDVNMGAGPDDACDSRVTLWNCASTKLGAGNGFTCAQIQLIQTNAAAGYSAADIAQAFSPDPNVQSALIPKIEACVAAN